MLHQAPDGTSWIVAIASGLLFAGLVVPAAVEANARILQEREKRRKAAAVPTAREVADLLRTDPLPAKTWPAWSRRLRSWLGDTSHNTGWLNGLTGKRWIRGRPA